MPSRRTRVLLGLATVAVSATALTACAGGDASSGSAADSGTLTWARPAASNGWEGDKCVDTSIPLNPAVYDTLLRIEVPEGDGLAPGLAKEWSWDEAELAYTFVLREDAAFSNGDPLTADDVVFSVDQWTTGEFSSSYYINVDHAEAVDEHTVKVLMKATDTFLPDLLTWCTSPIYPTDFAGMDKEAYFQQPIGAGPYAVASWTDPMGTAEKITLIPNEHYYGWDGGEAPLDEIIVQTIPDANQRALEFQSGNVDLLDNVDAAMAGQLAPETLKQSKPNRIQTVIVNELAPGLSNPAIRQALSSALDREVLAETLADGAIAGVGALPVNVPGEVEPTVPYAYDPEKSQDLIAGSGETDLEFVLLYDPSSNTHNTLAQAVQAQLAEIGITVTFETTDGNTLISRQASGDFELSLTSPAAISPTIFDPISWIAIQYGWTGNTETTILDAFLAGTSTTDETVQREQALIVQDFITTDNGMIGLVNTVETYAAQDWIKGFVPLQYNLFYFDTLTD